MRGSARAPHTVRMPSRQTTVMNNMGHAHSAFAGVAKFIETVAINSSAVGVKVFDHLDKYLGRIEDIVIANRIAYVVFSVGGVFGFGKTQCMAPWKFLHRDRMRKVYILHQTPTWMDRATRMRPAKFPGRSRDQWSRHLWVLPTRSDAALHALLLHDMAAIQTTQTTQLTRTTGADQSARPTQPTSEASIAIRRR